MKLKVIIILFAIILTPLNSWCQSNNLERFDEIYKKEIISENNALSVRISKFPKEIKVINEQIKIAIKEGDFLTAYRLGVKIDSIISQNDDVKNFLGKIATKLGYLSKAENYFNEALKINPNSKWIYINKSSLLSDNARTSEALETINLLIQKYPNWFIGYNVKGTLYSNLGNKTEALIAYSKAIELEPKSAQVITNRGILYLEINKIEMAKADFKKAISIDPYYQKAVEKLYELEK